MLNEPEKEETRRGHQNFLRRKSGHEEITLGREKSEQMANEHERRERIKVAQERELKEKEQKRKQPSY